MLKLVPRRIAFTDTDRFIHPAFLRMVSERWPVIVDEASPEIVVFSVYPGYDFLRYPDAIRLFLTEENVLPDLNLVDFAFGYADLKFEDRYMRLPNYFFFDTYGALFNKIAPKDEVYRKTRFCNYIYSNPAPHPMRQQLFTELSAYSHVHSHGTHLRNAEPLQTATGVEGWHKAKIEILRQYKFTIVCENSSSPGYTTEKIVDALAADTIPIYWGNPHVKRDFNPERLIDVHSYPSLDAVVQCVKQLNENPGHFQEVLEKPIFTEANLAQTPSREKFDAFVVHVLSTPTPIRNRAVWGTMYESRLRAMALAGAEMEQMRVRARALGEDLLRWGSG